MARVPHLVFNPLNAQGLPAVADITETSRRNNGKSARELLEMLRCLASTLQTWGAEARFQERVDD
jgi:hypothetical protein